MIIEGRLERAALEYYSGTIATGLVAGRVYWDASSSQVKVYSGSSWLTLASLTGSGTITSKAIDNTNSVTLKDTMFVLQDESDTTKQLQFELSGISAGQTRTLTVPNFSGALATIATAQTFSDKTLDNSNTIVVKDANFTIQDDGDATKQAKFQASGIATGTTRTYTLPDASTTLVGADAAATLTNKTFDAEGTGNSLTNIKNANIKAGAAIAYSKLALTGSIVPADLANASKSGSGNFIMQDGPVINNPTIPDYAIFNEHAAPSTPGSGTAAVYVKSDKKLYLKDSAGTETQIGAGGSGELNLIDNPSDANNWSETGTRFDGSPTTVTTAGDLPLAGIIDTAIQMMSSSTVAGDETTDYVSYAFTTPASYAVKTKVEFWMRPGGNFVASEWTVSVYAGSTRQTLTTDSSGFTFLPNLSGKFTTYFDAAASTAYTLRFTRKVAGSAVAAKLNIANVIVGPGIQPQGAVVGEPVAYTPTFGNFGTCTNVSFTYTRFGRWARILGSFITGTLVADRATISLPSGLNIDTSSVPAATRAPLGYFWGSNNTATFWTTSGDGGLLFYNTGVTNALYFSNKSSTSGNALDSQNASSIAQTGAIMNIDAWVPIAEWSGSGTVNLAQNDVQYLAYDGTNTVYGPSGAVVPTIVASGVTTTTTHALTTLYPVQSGDSMWVEIQRGGSGPWVPVATAAVHDYIPLTRQNTGSAVRYYGIGVTASGATSLRVDFGNAGCTTSGTSYGATGASFPAAASDRYRVVVAKSGQAVGFGAATSSSSGLVSRESVGSDGDLGAVTVDSGTWTTIDSKKYKFVQVGKRVDFFARLESTTAASALTAFHFSLPADCPTPTRFSTSGDSEWVTCGTCAVAAGVASSIAATGSSMLYYTTGGGYQIYLYFASTAAKIVNIHLVYWTA